MAEDLYLCNKEGKLFVENSDLASAAKFKVTPVENEEAAQEVIDGSNGIIRYRYTMTDRLGKEALRWTTADKNAVFMTSKTATDVVWVSFEYLGAENEYKIDVENGALAAKAGSGIVFLTDLCDTENTTFGSRKMLRLTVLLKSVTFKSQLWKTTANSLLLRKMVSQH